MKMFLNPKGLLLAIGLVLMSCSLSIAEDGRSYLAPFLNKKYVLVSSDEKFDDIMQALGVGFLKRNLAKVAKPVMQLTEHEGKYTLSSESIFKNVYTEFKIGEKFHDETPDGRKVESLFTQDKNILTHTQYGDKITTTIREFAPDEVKVTVKVDDIVSVRVYKLLD